MIPSEKGYPKREGIGAIPSFMGALPSRYSRRWALPCAVGSFAGEGARSLHIPTWFDTLTPVRNPELFEPEKGYFLVPISREMSTEWFALRIKFCLTFHSTYVIGTTKSDELKTSIATSKWPMSWSKSTRTKLTFTLIPAFTVTCVSIAQEKSSSFLKKCLKIKL